MSYARSPREVCSTTIGTRFKARVGSWITVVPRRKFLACRTHRFSEAKRLCGHLRMLGDPFGDLVLEHAILQAAHELGIALVKFNYPLWLFVRRSDGGQRFGDTTAVDAHAILAREFAHQQTGDDAPARQRSERLRVWRRNLLALLLRLHLRLLHESVGFSDHHGFRYIESRISVDELLHDFVLEPHCENVLQLALEIGANVGAEFFHAALANAEAGDESVVDVRQFRFLNAHDLDGDVRLASGERGDSEIRRKIDVDIELVARFVSNQTFFNFLGHRVRSDD